MKEIFRIRHTVLNMGRQLEQLVSNQVQMTRAFDLMAKRAKSVEEMVVIEVMREVYQEYQQERAITDVQADSNTRSARIPAMALSR